MRPADENGKYPLTMYEWNSLRVLFATASVLESDLEKLKERLRLIPYGWRTARMLEVRFRKLLEKLYQTIPHNKLRALDAEMKNTHLHFAANGPSENINGVVYVEKKDFLALVNLLIKQECWSCEKGGKQARRCPIRRAILDCLHYDPTGMVYEDRKCEFCGIDEIG